MSLFICFQYDLSPVDELPKILTFGRKTVVCPVEAEHIYAEVRFLFCHRLQLAIGMSLVVCGVLRAAARLVLPEPGIQEYEDGGDYDRHSKG